MNINVYHQLFNVIVFTITGISIGILFDIFRIIRRSFKTPDLVTYIEDIIFWILTGAILLFTIFTFNNGEIRIYIFVGLFFGLCIYILTLSKYFIKINVKILEIIKNIIYTPIHWLIYFIKNVIFYPISNFLQKSKKWIKKTIQKTGNTNFPKNYHKINK